MPRNDENAKDNPGQRRKAEVHDRNAARKAAHDAEKEAAAAEREARKAERDATPDQPATTPAGQDVPEAPDNPDGKQEAEEAPSGNEAYGYELEVSDVPNPPEDAEWAEATRQQKATPEGAARPAEAIPAPTEVVTGGEIPPVRPPSPNNGVKKLEG